MLYQIQDEDYKLVRASYRLNSLKILQLFTIIALLLLTAHFPLRSVKAAEKQEPLRLIQADKLEQFYRGDVPVKKLTGNVIFQKGELRLACDLVFWYEKAQRADFFGQVVATKQYKRLTADTLTYYSNEEVLIARGKPQLQDDSLLIRAKRLTYLVKEDEAQARQNVWLNDGKRTVTADRLTYFAPQKKSIALGNATIDDQKQRTTLSADSLIYYNQSGLIEATLSPILTRYDSAGTAEFKIKGQRIVLAEQAGNFSAEQQVVIWREDFTATGEKLTYSDSLELAILEHNPKVISDQQELTGRLMKMRFRDQKLEALFIVDDAKASAHGKAYLPADSTGKAPTDTIPIYDEITGKYMEIFFVDGRTDSIRVFPMAASQYHVLEDSVIIGTNEVSGDTVLMKFVNNRLARIRVIEGTEGRFLPHPTNRDLDTTVVYSSEFIDYDVQHKQTALLKNASMRMGDTQLTAGKIFIEWNANLLYADPLVALAQDSSSTNIPTLFQRGREPFAGENMVYNLKTQRGRIVMGKTREQDGYYYGQHISKVDQKVFYVTDGMYTTCDLPQKPHFYFRSKQMKIIFRDKVIAKPIVLYIYDIPVLALPFGVFPNRGGRRHSGWIMPSWGESKITGGALRGFGYFWAPNDYVDFKLTSDFYDKQGIYLHYQTRYALRYKFEGSLSGTYRNHFLSYLPKKQWSLNIRHSQRFSPTMNLSINGQFVSDEELYRRYRFDREDRLNQYLISNATLTKSWPGKYSLSVNLNQEINLQAQAARKTPPTTVNQRFNYINRSLPNISLTRTTKPLLPAKAGAPTHWYNNIYLSLSSRFNNKQNIYYTSYRLDDTTLAWQEENLDRNAITHTISLNGAQKLFKVIAINPSVSIDESWVFEYEEPVIDQNGNFVIDASHNLVTRKVANFRARHTGSASLNAQTKLYGLFPVRIGGLQGFRHVMTPSVGLTYRPDFSKPIFGWDPGYVLSGTDSLGNSHTYDIFSNTLIGSTPTGSYRTMNLGLGNLFQMKTMRNGEAKKVDLFTLNTSASYNFAADSLQWSPISTSLRTQVTKKVALTLSATHDLYKIINGRRINQWHKTYRGIPIPRTTNLSASTGFALAGKKFSPLLAPTITDTTLVDTLQNEILNPNYSNSITEKERPIPESVGADWWNANFSLRYNLTFDANGKPNQPSFWMSMNLRVNLTDKWRLTYQANFDVIKQTLVSQDIRIERNLHCWQLAFSWTPSGYGKQYSLLINIVSPTLRDIKYEERGGLRRGPNW